MKKLNFQFWQSFSKALMVVVAVMPAAGIAIGIGKLFNTPMILGNIRACAIIGNIIEQLGWVVIVNLPILFAVAIGGTWAKDRAGGAFAAIMAFLVMNKTIGVLSADLLGIPVSQLLTDANPKRLLFTNFMGFETLQMGAVGGMIAGFLGANLYNKYHAFDKLPNSLAFFNGKRFVPIITLFWGAVVGAVAVFVWPPIQTVINQIGQVIANPNSSIAALAPFLYGSLERLLLPLGLHHMITIPINYSDVGGIYKSVFDGTVGAGQDPAFRVWVSDMIKAVNDPAKQDLITSLYMPGRFKVGQIITSFGSLIGASLAMLHVIPKERRAKYKPMFYGAMGAAFVAGVTEPVEFMFMFISPVLLVGHAILTGIAFMLPDLAKMAVGTPIMSIHSFGLIEFILNGVIQVGVLSKHHLHWITVLIGSGMFGCIYYSVFKFLIIKLDIKTPGRYEEESDGDDEVITAEEKPARVLAALGGQANLAEIDACMTRLRVTVNDTNLIKESEFKKLGASGVIKKDNGVQVIFGPEADVLKTKIKKIIGG